MAGVRQGLLLLLLAGYGCRAGGDAPSRTVVAAKPSSVEIAPSFDMEESQPRPRPSFVEGEIQPVSAEAVPLQLPDLPEESQPESGNSLSLFGTVSLALAHNPDLVAIRQTEPVGVAAYGVARTYPFNPLVQVQATPYQELPGQGPGTTAHYVLLMQRIQLAHQQRYREDAGAASLNGVRWGIHQAELQAVSLTAQMYFSLLYQRGLLEVAKASHENNMQLLEVLMKRFEGGDAAASDVATVRVDTRATLQQLGLAEANYESARRDLLRQLGMPPTSPFDFAGNLAAVRWQMPNAKSDSFWSDESGFKIPNPAPQQMAWIASWAASRPDVLAAHANIDLARANLRLATANRVPDVVVGPYYQQSPDGMTHLGFRAEMDLLIIDNKKPMEAQRAAEFGQLTVAWRQLLLRAELEAQTAFERYEVAYQAVVTAGGNDLAEMPQEFQSLERQFREGEVDVVRVLQARTSILQNQRALLGLLNELAQSAALLVGASGMPLESLLNE